MLNPFDPIPELATMLHEAACAGNHGSAIRPGDCLAARDAAETLRRRLVDAGLAVAPLHAVRWIERTFSDLVEERPAETAPDGRTSSESRAREQVWIEVRYHDGRPALRMGPYQRAWAELCLGEMNFSHDAAMAGARIVPEPDWVNDLFRDLADRPS